MESKTGNTTESRFIDSWEAVVKIVHKMAVDHGFWSFPEGHERNKGEALALIHSELSEALEAVRDEDGKYRPTDKHLPHRESVTVELADAVIRIMDFAEGFGYKDLPIVIMEKIRYNSNRPKKHGKRF
ncbi:hypothetical protein LCGC14_2837800 [marine sediment metagenome]|uniref:NTP pyrophosphohydrolase MazG putative catalytic core domain-containing protein n=1 Tax=marine sediment metagenome TaxID=412755 RepID=A0A0F8YYS3_9ZZZZ